MGRNACIFTLNWKPGILNREAEDVWLDPLVLDSAKLLPLLKPYPPEQMEFHPVSQIVNSPANDSPDCLTPTAPLAK